MRRFLNGRVNVQESQRPTGYFEGVCQDSAVRRSHGIRNQHFAKICEAGGLRSFPGSPTVLRYENLMKKIYVNVHVADILLSRKEVQWFQDAVGSTLTMKVDLIYQLVESS